MLHGLYIITDGSIGTVLLGKVEQALQGGAAIVQYRDKSTDAARRLQEALALKALCQQYQTTLIINDDVQLALDCQADGVHVGKDDVALAQARQRLGDKAIIGVSCYNRLDLAQTAYEQGANYIAFGSFFPSSVKPNAPKASLELLTQARQTFPTLPICCIGGITLATAPSLISHGTDMLAVITDVLSANNISQQAQHYVALF